MKAFGFLLENLGLENLEGDDRMKVTKVGYDKCVGWQYFGSWQVSCSLDDTIELLYEDLGV